MDILFEVVGRMLGLGVMGVGIYVFVVGVIITVYGMP